MQINLSGMWKATEDLGAQARAGKPGYDDAGWRNVPVPGHWQESPGLEHHTGSLLYRKSFPIDRAPAPGETARLRFEGIFYDAKVWLNGAFIGEHKGYFIPSMYDVTRHLRAGENVVMVEVDCPPEESPNNKRQIMGVFTDWACKPPGAQPGGIWRDVVLELYHGVLPERFTLHAAPDRLPPAGAPDAPIPSNGAPDRLPPAGAPDAPIPPDGEPDATVTATVDFEMEFAALGEGSLSWTATVRPETFAGDPVSTGGTQTTRRGLNRLHAALTIPDARLWWTWDHGRPDLYRLTLAFSHEGGPIRRIERIFGVRQVELHDAHFYLNGRRIFLRGTNYGPADIRLARVKREGYQRDLDLMIGANMNTVRVYAHVAGAELYEEASRKGMLLWQDFPLHRLYSRSIADEAKRQARALVDLLGHWPAIGLWCCHSNPVRTGAEDDPSLLDKSLAVLDGITGNWNRSGLDPALRSVIRQADPTRPCLAHSGDWGAGDGRLYWGWQTGQVRELADKLKGSPDLARFVTEFGAQAFPVPANSAKFVRGQWPNINWADLAEQHMLQPRTMERHIPHSLAQTFEQYVAATQRYQAYLHKHHIEQFRRRKYHPTGGVLQFLFTDSAPGVTWSIVDYWRAPKAAYQVVRDCFAPLYIMADWPQGGYAPGETLAARVYLVNDRYQTCEGTWTWAIERQGTSLATGTWPAHLPPDSVAAAVEPVEWTVPAGLAAGAAELLLTLDVAGADPVVNRYSFEILPPR